MQSVPYLSKIVNILTYQTLLSLQLQYITHEGGKGYKHSNVTEILLIFCLQNAILNTKQKLD